MTQSNADVDSSRSVPDPAREAWSLWGRQLAALLGIEVRRTLLGRRSLPLYLLAGFPVFLFFLLIVVDPDGSPWIFRNWSEAQEIYANIFDALILRTMLFFGCAWIFMNLFRGEIIDQSLHYYFLAPLRREVLLIGKYLAGLVVTVCLFSFSTLGSLFFFYYGRGYPANVEHLLGEGGWRAILAYESITLLGCLGYGAIFLIVGLFFRNPILPALFVYGWEWLNFLLPPLLKRISIVHYLESQLPVQIEEGPFVTVVAATPFWVSLLGLLVFVGLLLVGGARRIRSVEVKPLDA